MPTLLSITTHPPLPLLPLPPAYSMPHSTYSTSLYIHNLHHIPTLHPTPPYPTPLTTPTLPPTVPHLTHAHSNLYFHPNTTSSHLLHLQPTPHFLLNLIPCPIHIFSLSQPYPSPSTPRTQTQPTHNHSHSLITKLYHTNTSCPTPFSTPSYSASALTPWNPNAKISPTTTHQSTTLQLNHSSPCLLHSYPTTPIPPNVIPTASPAINILHLNPHPTPYCPPFPSLSILFP